jgi:hypothetical protein
VIVPAPVSDDDLEREAYEARLERELRNAHRHDRRSFGSSPPRCGGCSHFISTPSSPCGFCGFDNGLGRYPI